MKTNSLYKTAERDKIKIFCLPLPHTRSLSVMYNQNCYIGLDTLALETEAQERECLAHELGHCETGSFYSIASPSDVYGRHEERAWRWAIQALIPQKEWYAALAMGIREIWELAEYFDVPESFIKRTCDYYKMLKDIEQE